jgi:magnesium-transporting ATPase (P-type)
VHSISKNQEGRWGSTGDPTEVALQVFATKLGKARATLSTAGASEDEHTRSERELEENPETNPVRYHLKAEYPFDSSIKRMSTIFIDRKRTDAPLALLKGAVERVQDCCSHYLAHSHAGPEHTVPLTLKVKERISETMEQLAGQGLRVLALASRRLTEGDDLDALKREDVEREFTFIGLVGIYDPPRPESIHAVRACKEANITVHMWVFRNPRITGVCIDFLSSIRLTGDHVATARAIAKEIKIVMPNDPPSAIMTAAQFNKLTDKEIDALPELPLVIARCDPETKVRMILAAGRRGKYTAMTGDGVNDAPSLKLAPVGIAMGMDGSDVAKDVSELVLTGKSNHIVGFHGLPTYRIRR